MHPWYRLLYTVALVFAVLRALPLCRRLPLWCALLSCCLAAQVLGPSPAAVLAIALLRVLAAVEAFLRLTLKRWAPGSHLLLASWLLAAGATLVMRMFISGEVDPLVLRRYVSIWNGLWLLFAVLFFATWGESPNRAWRHVSMVLGLVWVEAVGALVKLSGVSDSGWWIADRVLYLSAAALLVTWGIIAAQPRLVAGSYPAKDSGSPVGLFLAP